MKSLLQKARGLFTPRGGGVLGQGLLRRASLERRKIKRLACHQSFVCSNGKESWPVTVVDLGFGGFKIRSQADIGRRGDYLHLRRLSADHTTRLGSSYTTGLMARICWSKKDDDGWELGLSLPEAPGSMRIRWFKELMQELGMDETEVFSKRVTRRHRCRLPATMAGALPPVSGMLLDLSPGGGLFASSQAALMGSSASLRVEWGVKVLSVDVTVVGVRPAPARELELRFLHSLKFEAEMDAENEAILCRWLEELALND